MQFLFSGQQLVLWLVQYDPTGPQSTHGIWRDMQQRYMFYSLAQASKPRHILQYSNTQTEDVGGSLNCCRRENKQKCRRRTTQILVIVPCMCSFYFLIFIVMGVILCFIYSGDQSNLLH